MNGTKARLAKIVHEGLGGLAEALEEVEMQDLAELIDEARDGIWALYLKPTEEPAQAGEE